jgi:hypothetical protein
MLMKLLAEVSLDFYLFIQFLLNTKAGYRRKDKGRDGSDKKARKKT